MHADENTFASNRQHVASLLKWKNACSVCLCTGMYFIIRTWLVALTDENALATYRQHIASLFLCCSEEIILIEWTELTVNDAKSCWNIDFCQYRNDVCQVMANCLGVVQLTLLYINSMCSIVNTKCSCACSFCRKMLGPKCDLPESLAPGFFFFFQ